MVVGVAPAMAVNVCATVVDRRILCTGAGGALAPPAWTNDVSLVDGTICVTAIVVVDRLSALVLGVTVQGIVVAGVRVTLVLTLGVKTGARASRQPGSESPPELT